jgi:hypothetical protein
MESSGIPGRQPDSVPEHVAAPPSLLLYSVLVLVAVGLITVSFYHHEDWPALLLHLGSEILGAVIILILVDRRLRASELQSIRFFPKRVQLMLFLARARRHRQLYRYVRALLASLETLTANKIERQEYANLEPKLLTGFILFGKIGFGKTTWLQIASARLARQYLQDPKRHKIPMLFPLGRWLPDRTLEDALYEHVNSFGKVSRRSFRNTLSAGQVVGIFDGLNEVYQRITPGFYQQFSDIRKAYPKVAWTVSSRPNMPPLDDIESVNLTPPTPEEILAIRQRLGI